MHRTVVALIAAVALLVVGGVIAWNTRTREPVATKDCIQGSVSIAPALAGSVQPGGTLFVFAREVDRTSGAPTVVASIKEPTYPQSFQMCPGDRMIAALPATELSGRYRVHARHSATGVPMVEEGWAGSSAGASGAGIQAGEPVDVVIDHALDPPR